MSNRTAASLTGSLLVRKGAAAPSPLGRELGVDAPPPGRYVPAPERAQDARSMVALRVANDKPAMAPRMNDKPHVAVAKTASAASGAEPPASRRFTLRLSQDQHKQLRLASVHLGLSGQKMLLKALDEYLGRIAPELAGGNCACILDGAAAPLVPRSDRSIGKMKPAR